MAQLGRYEILQRLARGSVADVLLARASGLEGFARHVVIKQIRAEHAVDTRFVKAFLDEARIGASLNHHNIVQVFDIDQVGGSPFFAMEYVHGEDVRRLLAKVVSKGKQVPIEIVVAIGAAAAAGLHHAHEQNGPDRQPLDLVHRDVSPSNILIGFDGSVKLVDFGLAKPALSSAKTRGGALGKAPYMSPELCSGHPVDRRSDLFSLGIVLYELATARRLFKGDNDYHTMSMIVEGTVPPPSTLRPELPPELDAIIMRALAKSREARYQTAYDLRSDLENLATERELRTTAKALADYLASVFGARPEPWHVDGGAIAGDSDNDEVDFDAIHGIVPTPSKGLPVQPDLESPIALAREVALGNTPDPDADRFPDAFDDQATRLDLSTEDEDMATVTGRKPNLTGESTMTVAQPIVDVLTGVQPHVKDVLVTGETVTINDGESTTIDETAYSARTAEALPSRPSVLTTPPGNPPLARTTIPARGFPPPIPAFGFGSQPPLAHPEGTGSLAHAVPASPHAGSAVQAGPHGAIVPVMPPVTRADDDAADEATTVEPPLFPMPGLEIDGPPPEQVYIPPPHTGSMPTAMPMAKRWTIVAAVVVIPLVIGLIAHACSGDIKPAAVHGGP